MARTTSVKRLVDGLDGEASTKTELEAILDVLADRRTVAQACEALGVSEATFHRMRDRALAGALVGLVPKAAGRPRKAEDLPDDVTELKRQLQEARFDLEASRLREEIALVMPHLLRRDEKKSPKRPSVQELFERKRGTRRS